MPALGKEYTLPVSGIQVHRYRSFWTKRGNLYSTHWWDPIDYKDLKPGMEIVAVDRPGHRLMVEKGPVKRYPHGIRLVEYTGPDVPLWTCPAAAP